MHKTNKSYGHNAVPRKDGPGSAGPPEATSRVHGWLAEGHKGVTGGGEPEGAAPNNQE